ncbi:zinc-binding dehydrogenase [Jatrophihabitans lederbergiae]|uniref:Zinc-binding dehydrogenase n=1 Tax=Jatrophihabitans lederbergiae TaxID=3075547 RepID=A0ABU2JI51_9ACTN|nr:zinc-binding dehydrogenase [Jatrophihabitans sp. DSM 44399]MDT0263933.1 zinc-binding dehydrogenase [Jatrophihabitans sp. DSM 44399]
MAAAAPLRTCPTPPRKPGTRAAQRQRTPRQRPRGHGSEPQWNSRGRRRRHRPRRRRATAHASLASVRDGGAYITAVPPFLDDLGPFTSERGIRLDIQNTYPDSHALARLLVAIGRGELTSGIECTYPLAEAAEAHPRQARGGLRGKLVLLP